MKRTQLTIHVHRVLTLRTKLTFLRGRELISELGSGGIIYIELDSGARIPVPVEGKLGGLDHRDAHSIIVPLPYGAVVRRMFHTCPPTTFIEYSWELEDLVPPGYE